MDFLLIAGADRQCGSYTRQVAEAFGADLDFAFGTFPDPTGLGRSLWRCCRGVGCFLYQEQPTFNSQFNPRISGIVGHGISFVTFDGRAETKKLARGIIWVNLHLMTRSVAAKSMRSAQACFAVDGDPRPMKAPRKRSTGVLEVRCPACGHVNQFPHFDVVFIFICHECGEPIEVIERSSSSTVRAWRTEHTVWQ